MRRRGKTIALTAVALGLVVLVGAGIAAKDRIAEEWWIYKLKTGDEEEKKAAAERLGEMRSVKAVYLLVEGLGQEKTVLPDLEWVKPAESIVEAPEGAATEAEVFGEGSPTEEPPGEVEEPLPHLECRASALAKIGAPAIPALIEAFEKGKLSQRPYIAEILGAMGAEAKDAVPVLCTALGDKGDLVASNAASWALGSIGSDAVPALFRAVKEKDELVRSLAMEALIQIGREGNAKDVVPVVTESLFDGHPMVRLEAAQALATFGTQAAEAIPALEKALQDKDVASVMRQELEDALSKIKGDAAAAGEAR